MGGSRWTQDQVQRFLAFAKDETIIGPVNRMKSINIMGIYFKKESIYITHCCGLQHLLCWNNEANYLHAMNSLSDSRIFLRGSFVAEPSVRLHLNI